MNHDDSLELSPEPLCSSSSSAHRSRATIDANSYLLEGRGGDEDRLPPQMGMLAAFTLDLVKATFLHFEGRATTHFTRTQTRAQVEPTLELNLGLRAALLFGVYLGR